MEPTSPASFANNGPPDADILRSGSKLKLKERSNSNDMGDDNKLSFFFLGLGLGVAVGILFAPKSGQETRELLKNKASESGDYLIRQSGTIKETAGDLLERGKTVLNRQKDTLAEAVEAGKQAYRDTVNAAAGSKTGVEGV